MPPYLTITIFGAIALAILGLFGTSFLGTQKTTLILPSVLPSPSQTPSPTLELTPIPSTNKTTPPTITPKQDTVQRNLVTTEKTPTPSPTTSPVPILTKDDNNEPRIEFVNLPSEIPSGEHLTVTWKISGPIGASGENTTLQVLHEQSTSSGASHSSVSDKMKQSFGSFQLPHTFSTNLTLSDNGGPIDLDASAIVDGHTVTTHATVQLVH